jgi:hypothetical protein
MTPRPARAEPPAAGMTFEQTFRRDGTLASTVSTRDVRVQLDRFGMTRTCHPNTISPSPG